MSNSIAIIDAATILAFGGINLVIDHLQALLTQEPSSVNLPYSSSPHRSSLKKSTCDGPRKSSDIQNDNTISCDDSHYASSNPRLSS